MENIPNIAYVGPYSGPGVSNYPYCLKVHPGLFTTGLFYNLCRLKTTYFSDRRPGLFFVFSWDKAKKQSGIKNPGTSTGHHPQYRLHKIVVQTTALLPNSESGVSNYLFRLNMHPGPNMALFFTPVARFFSCSFAG
jgi:hypothetical protein